LKRLDVVDKIKNDVIIKRRFKMIIDISIDLKNNMINWPGVPKFLIKSFLSMKNKDACNLSLMNMTTHTGTHLDAPLHMIDEGKSIDTVLLDKFYGKTLVVDCTGCPVITKEHLAGIDFNKYKKILFKTDNSDHFLRANDFRKTYVYLDHEAAKLLADKKLDLVGIDAPSIDKYATPAFTSHKILMRSEIVILEFIDLKTVEPGEYILSALPLKILGSDGSPTRAILIR
jgi:arylformamidase